MRILPGLQTIPAHKHKCTPCLSGPCRCAGLTAGFSGTAKLCLRGFTLVNMCEIVLQYNYSGITIDYVTALSTALFTRSRSVGDTGGRQGAGDTEGKQGAGDTGGRESVKDTGAGGLDLGSQAQVRCSLASMHVQFTGSPRFSFPAPLTTASGVHAAALTHRDTSDERVPVCTRAHAGCRPASGYTT